MLIEKDGKRLAIIIRKQDYEAGTNFATEPTDNVQVGVLFNPKGRIIAPHVNKPEVLIVESGEVEAHIYDQHGDCALYYNLKPGDILIQLSGGHSFIFNEDSKMVEVKPGQYHEGDKKYL